MNLAGLMEDLDTPTGMGVVLCVPGEADRTEEESIFYGGDDTI